MRSTPTRPRPALAASPLLAAALALALAGCTGSSGAAQQPRAGGSSPAHAGGGAPGGGTYDDGSAVLGALKAAGRPCTVATGSGGTKLSAPGLRSAATCTLGGSGSGSAASGDPQTVTVTVFDDHTDALAYAGLMTSSQADGLLIGSSNQRAVVGGNWVVLVPDDPGYAGRVSAALGGTLVGPASSPG